VYCFHALLASGSATEVAPSLSNLEKTADSFQFTIQGTVGSAYQIQTSDSLQSWSDWMEVTNLSGSESGAIAGPRKIITRHHKRMVIFITENKVSLGISARTRRPPPALPTRSTS